MKLNLWHLSYRSAVSRRGNVLLAVMSIALSIVLLLSVDMLRKQSKESFLNTISATDLIVGARSGPINLMLYSVFHLGSATNNIRYQTYLELQQLKQVDWAVPLSLGDSHKGFRVIGTEPSFFEHYKYGQAERLQFDKGQVFSDLYDVVIGANVAKKLGYRLADDVVLSHGINAFAAAQHQDKPFFITGILKSTGTPVDNSLQVSLQAIEAIHIDWKSGMRSPLKITAQQTRKIKLKPKQITAMMVGLKNPLYTFKVQRQINQWRAEPLMAILPGATLASFWQLIGFFEKILLAISAMVLVTGLLGMLMILLSTLNERRREIAVLRAIGMHSWDVIKLIMIEASMIMGAAIVIGVAGLYCLMLLAFPWIAETFGLHLKVVALDSGQGLMLLTAFALALLMSLIPGWMAYRRSISDGLSIRD